MTEIRAVQLKELAILESFDEFCRRQGLRYFLVSGSLIGAMRHNGFIPWDDDIDLGMPADDYRRLMRMPFDCLPKSLGLIRENSPGSWLGFAKVVCGDCDIDIFPFETMPRLPYGVVRRLFILRHGSFHRMRDAHKQVHRVRLAWWSGFHLCAVGLWKFLNVLFPCGGWHMRPESGFPPHAREDQFVPLKEHEFEGRPYPIPADYDAVLSTEYENWRELPPIEQRKPKHRKE